MKIRQVQEIYKLCIDRLIKTAFTSSNHGYNGENNLVERIRQRTGFLNELEQVILSDDGDYLAYGLLSEVTIQTKKGEHKGLVLAPLVVKPDEQGKGLGSLLLTHLEQDLKTLGYPYISILGDPNFYGRLDYIQANSLGILAPFEIDSSYFLIK